MTFWRNPCMPRRGPRSARRAMRQRCPRRIVGIYRRKWRRAICRARDWGWVAVRFEDGSWGKEKRIHPAQTREFRDRLGGPTVGAGHARYVGRVGGLAFRARGRCGGVRRARGLIGRFLGLGFSLLRFHLAVVIGLDVEFLGYKLHRPAQSVRVPRRLPVPIRPRARYRKPNRLMPTTRPVKPGPSSRFGVAPESWDRAEIGLTTATERSSAARRQRRTSRRSPATPRSIAIRPPKPTDRHRRHGRRFAGRRRFSCAGFGRPGDGVDEPDVSVTRQPAWNQNQQRSRGRNDGSPTPTPAAPAPTLAGLLETLFAGFQRTFFNRTPTLAYSASETEIVDGGSWGISTPATPTMRP